MPRSLPTLSHTGQKILGKAAGWGGIAGVKTLR